MLNDVQEKILINEKNLLEQIKVRDEVIDYLLDVLEEEHMGSRGTCSEEILIQWGLQY